MSKLGFALKKYYFILLNGLLPFLIFFLPVFNTTYKDTFENITLSYNFYRLLNFNNNFLFALLVLLLIIFAVVNLAIFLVLMGNDLFSLKHRKIIYIIIFVINLLMIIIALIVLIYSIILSTHSNNIYQVYNTFNLGSIVLFVYAIIQFVITINKIKNKEI